MAYLAYITKLNNVRPHPNADRLQLGDCFGNTVCVSLDYYEGQLGIYFPTDGQLSVEYAEHNNLLRKKDENGNNVGGYMDPDKRNVTSIKLRGEKSDGLFMPLESLAFTGIDINTLTAGTTIDVVNGIEICKKYIPKSNSKQRISSEGNKTRKVKRKIAPLFAEHADTEQLAYNLSAFKAGDLVEITLKMHGTSQRTGYLPVYKGEKQSFWQKLFHKIGTPIYDWGYVSGTRRTVLEDFEGGFYGSNEFREQHSKVFEGKLWKGETVYYEVVSYLPDGTPIMGECSNKNDKEIEKMYGKTTIFHYGCSVGQSDLYVYRMTMTNEDGNVIDYSPDFMRYRCEQMGVKVVPVFESFIIPNDVDAGEYVKQKAEQYYDGPDPIGRTHIREGIVCRIVNRPKFSAYKHKNFTFKYLTNIIKEKCNTADNDILSEL